MVGGGAGGVEISLALNHRLKEERSAAGQADAADCSVSLFTSSHILTGHTPAARRKFLRIAQVCPCSLQSAPAPCTEPLLLAICPAPCILPLLLAICPCSLHSPPAPCNLPLLLAMCLLGVCLLGGKRKESQVQLLINKTRTTLIEELIKHVPCVLLCVCLMLCFSRAAVASSRLPFLVC